MLRRGITALFITAVIVVLAQAGQDVQGDGLFPTTTTTQDTLPDRLARLEAEIRRVDGEVYKSNVDQAHIGERVVRLERIAATRDDVWYRLRVCESGNNYRANTGNGYYGAYQASHSTWGGYAGYSDAHLAPPAVQDEWAKRLHTMRGWQPWPACSRKLGLR